MRSVQAYVLLRSARTRPPVLETMSTMAAGLETEATTEIAPRRVPPTLTIAAAPDSLPARSRGWLVRRALIVSDLVACCLVFLMVDAWTGFGGARIDLVDGAAAASVPLGLLGLFAAYGLYRNDEFAADHTTADELPSIFHALTVAGFVCLAVAATSSSLASSAVLGWGTAVLAVPAMRSFARMIIRRRAEFVQGVLIVGAGDVGQLVATKLAKHPEYGLRAVGFVDQNPRAIDSELAHVPVVGGPKDISRLAQLHGVQRIIVAFDDQSHARQLETVRAVRDLDVHVDIVPRLFEALGPRVQVSALEGLTVLGVPPSEVTRPTLAGKRALDLVLSTLALIAIGPVVGVIAFALWLEDRGPILYRGRRVGADGRFFDQLKFRSMSVAWSEARFAGYLAANPAARDEFERTQKLARDPRVTSVGRFLRRTSLDELPQLLNVLRGDLSLVGPRPITEVERTERYRPRIEDPRADVRPRLGYWDIEGLRPGLTGFWQINGRSTMSFDERIRLDTAYLTNWSLKLDIAILTRTVRALFATRGAY